MVLADSRKISRVPRYSGAKPNAMHNLSPTGLSPAMARLSRLVRLEYACTPTYLQFGPVRSHYTTMTKAVSRMSCMV